MTAGQLTERGPEKRAQHLQPRFFGVRHAGMLGCDREAAPSVDRSGVKEGKGEKPREAGERKRRPTPGRGAVQPRGSVGAQNLDIRVGA